MGEDDFDPPLILGRPFLNTTRVIIYIRTGEVHFQFPFEKVCRYLTNYTVCEDPKRTNQEGCTVPNIN